MSIVLNTPHCIVRWTDYTRKVDLKYPHSSGLGYYKVTGSFDKEGRDKVLADVIGEHGSKANGSVATKSDGTGRTEINFKCLERLKLRDGTLLDQKPSITNIDGSIFEGDFEMAIAQINYQPIYYASYGKTSMILKSIKIISLANPDQLTPEEEDLAVLQKLDAVPKQFNGGQ